MTQTLLIYLLLLEMVVIEVKRKANDGNEIWVIVGVVSQVLVMVL